jgi:hypothetical protein
MGFVPNAVNIRLSVESFGNVTNTWTKLGNIHRHGDTYYARFEILMAGNVYI